MHLELSVVESVVETPLEEVRVSVAVLQGVVHVVRDALPVGDRS